MSERILAQTARNGLSVLDLATGVTLGNFKKASSKSFAVSFATASPCTSHVAASTSVLAVSDANQPFLHVVLLNHLESAAQSHSVPEPLLAVAFSPCGSFCIGGGASGNVYIWDMTSGQLLRCWRAHYKAVTCIAVSSNGSFLITASDDSIVSCYSMEDVLCVPDNLSGLGEPRRLHRWGAHSMPVVSMALCELNPQQWVVITASLDRTVHIWKPHCERPVASYIFPCHIRHVASNPATMECYACASDMKIYVVDVASQIVDVTTGAFYSSSMMAGCQSVDTTAVLIGHEAPVVHCGFSMDGSTLVSCGDDGIRIWDTLSRQVVKHFPAVGDTVTAVSIFTEDPYLRALKSKNSLIPTADHITLSFFPPLQSLKRNYTPALPKALVCTVHRGDHLRQEFMFALDARSVRDRKTQGFLNENARLFYDAVAEAVPSIEIAHSCDRTRLLEEEQKEFAATVEDLFTTLCELDNNTANSPMEEVTKEMEDDVASGGTALLENPLAWLQRCCARDGYGGAPAQSEDVFSSSRPPVYPYMDRRFVRSQHRATTPLLSEEGSDDEELELLSSCTSFTQEDVIIETNSDDDRYSDPSNNAIVREAVTETSDTDTKTSSLPSTPHSRMRKCARTAKRQRASPSVTPTTDGSVPPLSNGTLSNGRYPLKEDAEASPRSSLVSSPARPAPPIRGVSERHRRLRVSAAMSRRLRLIQWLSQKATTAGYGGNS